ncbi:hypothetical protein SAMD00019534_111050 [Acytostelium subglobosum LB1]|uniref:hypothetical protein n=1 Tax=Acytostelium subglobosum LB1 TaxID=1410327 RepID=UPI00064499D7|nr:hypothetical protein SAMD00019534_111050 [Acytostelium subglobosum LB1]GAM27929.1 hypothetical protein SAMD00019534_111050 [Acytostelium subglobosum LB1]|eukprot:XP_012749212.1 hypothetical protein SAMD00019534_111050 [Acytostelium subglobosum LB1]
MGVCKVDTEPHFTRFTSVDLNRVIEIVDDYEFWHTKNLETALETVLHQEIHMDETSPLMRITCFWHQERTHQFFLVINFNHVVSDGLGTKAVVEDLLTMSNSLTEVEDLGQLDNIISLVDEGTFKMTGTLDNHNPSKMTIMEKLPVIVHHHYLPSIIKRQLNTFWAGSQRQEWDRCNSRIRLLTVPMDSFMSFVDNCWKNKVTPHSGIYTIILKCLSEVFGNERALSLRSSTIVNLRKPCKLADSDPGLYLSTINRDTVVPPKALEEPRNFWDETSKYKNHLRNMFTNSVRYSNMMEYITNDFPNRALEYWSKNISDYPMGRSSSFLLSDMGLYKISQEGEWTCKALMASQTAIVTGGTLMFSLVGSDTHESFIGTMSYQRGAITEAEGEHLVQAFIKNIHKYSTTPSNLISKL